MVLSVTAAVVLARTLLQGAARMLAKHATDELYQLTVIAFCLVGAWISGYLVRTPHFVLKALQRLISCHERAQQAL